MRARGSRKVETQPAAYQRDADDGHDCEEGEGEDHTRGISAVISPAHRARGISARKIGETSIADV